MEKLGNNLDKAEKVNFQLHTILETERVENLKIHTRNIKIILEQQDEIDQLNKENQRLIDQLHNRQALLEENQRIINNQNLIDNQNQIPDPLKNLDQESDHSSDHWSVYESIQEEEY